MHSHLTTSPTATTTAPPVNAAALSPTTGMETETPADGVDESHTCLFDFRCNNCGQEFQAGISPTPCPGCGLACHSVD